MPTPEINNNRTSKISLSKINTNNKTTNNNNISINFKQSKDGTKQISRPLGYSSAHKNTAKNKEIAQKFFDAMDGLGTDEKLMQEALKDVNKYNVLEILNEFQKLEDNKSGKILYEYINDDFSKFGGGSDIFGDDCRPYMEKFTKCILDRAADTEKHINNNINPSDQDKNSIIQDFIDQYEFDKIYSKAYFNSFKSSYKLDELPSNPTNGTRELVKIMNKLENNIYSN